uniref:Uncharacterized protein n=1 Tax=Anguilla anguilla TaxID=7936 RepID=A0A0E9VQ65_ANGAN
MVRRNSPAKNGAFHSIPWLKDL